MTSLAAPLTYQQAAVLIFFGARFVPIDLPGAPRARPNGTPPTRHIRISTPSTSIPMFARIPADASPSFTSHSVATSPSRA